MVLTITFLAMLPLYWLISKRILYNITADKEVTMVVMDKEEYVRKAQELLA